MPKKDAAFSVSAQVSQCVLFINPFSHFWIIYTNYLYGPIQLYQATLLFIIEFTSVIHYLWNVNYQTDTVWTCMKKKSQRKKKIGCGVCLTSGQWTRNKVLSITQPRASHLYSMSHQKCSKFFHFSPVFCVFSSHWRHFFFSLGLSPTFIYTHKLPFFFEPKISDHFYTHNANSLSVNLFN